MTAAELIALGAQTAEATQLARGMTDQARLIGLTAEAETFGLPPQVPHLIAKLRLVPPEILAQITHHEPEAMA